MSINYICCLMSCLNFFLCYCTICSFFKRNVNV
uniref:Uncharacterized protein n=1 Tax=Anguilla anguilla TaxID=7936 RepID=A0A0E9RXV5_ANGAN